MRVLKPWSLKLLVVAYLSWLLGTLRKTVTNNHFLPSTTLLQRLQEWTPTNVVLQSIALCHSAQGTKYLPKCFLCSSPQRRGHHIFIMHPLSPSVLAARHVCVHTPASHLPASCGPSFASPEPSWQTSLIDVLEGLASRQLLFSSPVLSRFSHQTCDLYMLMHTC